MSPISKYGLYYWLERKNRIKNSPVRITPRWILVHVVYRYLYKMQAKSTRLLVKIRYILTRVWALRSFFCPWFSGRGWVLYTILGTLFIMIEMAYIFMDESGDLWFDFSKQKTSRYFVITFLMTKDHKPWDVLIKKIISSLSKTARKRCNGVLHFHQEHPQTRTKLLSKLNQLDVSLMTVYVDKKHIYTHLQEEKHVLYNYITNILLDRIITKNLLPLWDLHLVVAKRETNKFLNQNFHTYLTQKALQDHNINLNILIESYHQSRYKCLQLVDAVCWTIFRKREHGDDSYYKLIKNKIIEENKLFW